MRMTPSSIRPSYITASIIHQHSKGYDYLLLRRSCADMYGCWQMVTGGVEDGEKAWEGALREIHEETGLSPDRFYTADTVETFYFKTTDTVVFAPVFVGFVKCLKPIQLCPREHDAFAWLPYDQAMARLSFPEQKRVLEHVHHHFVLRQPHPLLFIETNTAICDV